MEMYFFVAGSGRHSFGPGDPTAACAETAKVKQSNIVINFIIECSLPLKGRYHILMDNIYSSDSKREKAFIFS